MMLPSHGLSVSGEDKNYFARGRIAWLASCLRQLKEEPQSVMDFGCGTGSGIPYMLDLLAVKSILGLDVSTKSPELARHTSNSERTQFLSLSQYQPKGEMDLAFCNGVFHHIPLEERAATLNCIYRRYVMSRIPMPSLSLLLKHGVCCELGASRS
jgi:trans-aconitate methyltransferase